MNERTALYRLYDADDELLYVGVSNRFGRRWEQHARVQPWWPDVDHQTITWFPGREDALLAEKRAITDERPRYNRRDSPWEARPKDDGTGFEVVPREPKAPPSNTPLRNIRMDEDLWERFRVAAGAVGFDRSALAREFARWFVGDIDEMPGRPEPKRDKDA